MQGELDTGPGEVISEFNLGVRIKVAIGELSREEGQRLTEKFRDLVYDVDSLAPNIHWDTGSTQVKELAEELERIKETSLL